MNMSSQSVKNMVFASGSMTFSMTVRLLAPSICAASLKSLGMFLNVALKMRKFVPPRKLAFMTIMPGREL